VRVDVWADLVCPWCYLGKRRFDNALAEFGHAEDVEVVHHSFQLDPSFPKGQVLDQREMLTEKYGMTDEQATKSGLEMEERAAADGLEYNMTGIQVGNTVDAHQILHLGAKHGLAEAVAADGAEARALGANGVPFFVIDNRYGVSGAQPQEVFAKALTQAYAESTPA